MVITMHGRRFRSAVTALFLMGGLLVAAASPPAGAVSPDVPMDWRQVGGTIDGEAPFDWSGWSVAMSDDGSMVVVGAINNADNGANSGHARVFRLDAGAWLQVGEDIDGEARGDQFGESVAMSSDGTTVVIGAGGNSENGKDSGHARVYGFDGAAWVQVGDDIDGEAAGDQFGSRVVMSDDGVIVAISSPWNDDAGEHSGHVRVFRFDGAAWEQVGGDINGEAADDFAYSLAMSSDGSTVAVGASGNDGNGRSSGHARVFRFDGSAWMQVGADIHGEAAGDSAGSVAMSSDGATVVIGASGNDGNGTDSGHARVFRFDGSAWVQVGSDIDGEDAGDRSGSRLAMSNDGSTVIIGALSNDDNGRWAGHARVFRFDGSGWVQVGGDIDGEAHRDEAGRSVAMSGDGNTVIVGASGTDGGGPHAGDARVFELAEAEVLVCGDVVGAEYQLAAEGFNVVVGTEDADFLPGTPGPDFVLGLGGNDLVMVGMGADVVCAGGDHDVIVGGDGADRLHGNEGNDTVWAGNGDDWVGGGNGKDLLVGGDGADEVFGDNADDTIRGGGDDDVLHGGAGHDDVRGDAGNDMLFGDAADDVLRGHSGVDVCDGGTHVGGDQAIGCETLIDIP